VLTGGARPGSVGRMRDVHLPGMMFERAARRPGACAYRHRRGGPFREVTWSDARARFDRIAAGVLAHFAPPPGAVATILADTSWDWIACDVALLSLGLRTAPVYASQLEGEVGYIHADTAAQLAFVENAAQLAKLRAVRGGFRFHGRSHDALPLRGVVVLQPGDLPPADDWIALEALEAEGARALSTTAAERDRRLAALRRADPATYVYTSGTTGPPKGVIQTHENHLSILENVSTLELFDEHVRAAGAFLFLPLAHSFGRLIEFGSAFFESALVLSSTATLLADLQETRPGFVPAAPRVFEKIHARIQEGLAAAPPARRRLFETAMAVGRETIPFRERGRPLPLALRLRLAAADALVLRRIRERLGLDRANLLLSGSAPLSRSLHEFFLAAGIPLIEAYGLTETTPGLTGSRRDDFRLGTVGRPLPGVELRIADDGEILARGPNVTPGYLHRPDADAEAFDGEGFFHTGDVGHLDPEGFLHITDRKKDLLKTSGGKFVAPQKLEAMLKTRPLVGDVVVVGNERPYCVALVMLDPERLAAWATRTGHPADAAHPAVHEEVARAIEAVNGGLARFETIKKFRVVGEPLTVEGGLLTASFKVKRREVERTYRALIDEMYAG
jgi:long-chain acyl-CoA synthetase